MVGLGFAEDPIIGYDPSMMMDYSNVSGVEQLMFGLWPISLERYVS